MRKTGKILSMALDLISSFALRSIYFSIKAENFNQERLKKEIDTFR